MAGLHSPGVPYRTLASVGLSLMDSVYCSTASDKGRVSSTSVWSLHLTRYVSIRMLFQQRGSGSYYPRRHWQSPGNGVIVHATCLGSQCGHTTKERST